MNTTTNKPATWFWAISVIALLWNLIGVMAFFMQIMMTPEAIQAMPEAERHLYTDLPMWTTVAFAIAVFGDTLGSVLLLMRKQLATRIFIISIVFTLAQMFYNLFLTDLIAIKGIGSAVLPVIIVVVGFLLIWFARASTAKGWLK